MTDIWVLLVGQGTWQTLLVAGLVLTLVRVGRRWPAGIRHGLLAVALLKFLMPPFLGAPTGVLAALSPPVTVIDNPQAVSSEPAGWLPILAAIHLAGTAVMICFVLASWGRSLVWARRGSPAPAHVVELCTAVGARLGMRRRVELLLSGDVPSPLAAGASRPVILLPEPLIDALDARQLEAVITHELVHHRDRDLWWSWLRAIACALWWWNPAVWMVSRALRAVQEEACDDEVVSTGVMDRADYCDTLLRIATVDRAPLVGSLAFALRVHPLGQRGDCWTGALAPAPYQPFAGHQPRLPPPCSSPASRSSRPLRLRTHRKRLRQDWSQSRSRKISRSSDLSLEYPRHSIA